MNCILDTNTLIHYKLINEIDWLALLNEEKITLILCSTVMRELDEKKFADSNPVIKNRCRSVVSQLRNLLKNNGSEIRKNVLLQFGAKEPSIDWEQYALSKDIPDDRILATLIQYYPDAVLITSDFGCKLKAQAQGVKSFELPLELMIELKDKTEEENKRLRQQIATYENKSPLLSIQFDGNGEYEKHHIFTIKTIDKYDYTQQEIKIVNIRQNLKYEPITAETTQNSLLNIMGGLMSSLIPSQEEYKRYSRN